MSWLKSDKSDMWITLTLALGGLTTIGLGTGVIQRTIAAITPEAWMSFAGSLLGATITVWGSVLVLRYERRSDDRAKRHFFRDALSVVLESLDAIAANGTPSELERATMKPLNWHAAQISNGVEWLRKIMEWQPPDDMATLKAYDEVRQLSEQTLADFAGNARAAEGYINDQMAGVIGTSASIRQRLQAARNLVR